MIAIRMTATTTPTAAPTTAPLSLLPPEHDTQHLGHCNQLRNYILFIISGAGTNLKVGAPVRSESGVAPIRRRAGNFFPVVPREF